MPRQHPITMLSTLFYMCITLFACCYALAQETTPTVEVTIPPGGFRRIISLYSAHTENLYSLGAADQIIGVSTSDTYPPETESKKKYSYREDPERFIAAAPDLILVRPMIERSYPQLVSKIREAGITVVSLQPTSVDEIFAYWKKLGKLCGREDKALEMIHRFQEGLASMEKKVMAIPQDKRVRVYFESMHQKMKTFAPTSIALFVLKNAGGINIATDATQVRTTNIAAYSKERILAHAAEIDVFVAQQGRMNPVTEDTIRNETGFIAIKAVQKDNIVLINEQLVSRPTIRLLEGIEELHTKLYPISNTTRNEEIR